jgi:hypothetical protein
MTVLEYSAFLNEHLVVSLVNLIYIRSLTAHSSSHWQHQTRGLVPGCDRAGGSGH